MGCFIRILLSVAIYALLLNICWWLCSIEPGKMYSGLYGLWHGIFFFPNYIRSCFGDALYKADQYTTAYNVWYLIGAVPTTFSWVVGLLFGSGNSRNSY